MGYNRMDGYDYLFILSLQINVSSIRTNNKNLQQGF